MREIAAAVGIQQASMYHHMESKEELLYQICSSSLHWFLEQVPKSAAGPERRVAELIRAHTSMLLPINSAT